MHIDGQVARVRALSDQELLAGLSGVLGTSRQLTALLLAHLGEVDERRLHLIIGHGSLFAYCTGPLGMSEDEACRRIDVARHWKETHPFQPPAIRPSRMDRDDFVATFGGIFEHSPWIAERAYELELGAAHDSAGGLHNALCRVFRSASDKERLGVLNAHPDLAGKLAVARRLTPESAKEQASAGLDALTDAERELF